MKLRRGDRLDRMSIAVADLEVPPAVFKTCPWQPRELIETGCGNGYAAVRLRYGTTR